VYLWQGSEQGKERNEKKAEIKWTKDAKKVDRGVLGKCAEFARKRKEEDWKNEQRGFERRHRKD
jgi:hypothetical protein